jgi:hypothetical protein
MENILASCKPLSSRYTCWFHNPNDTNWSPNSYHEILNFATVEEFWTLHKAINPSMIENGMFFIVKEGILPIWEDQHNVDGGCISFKIEQSLAFREWENLLVNYISGNMDARINGVSISPKKNFNIIKLWFNELIDHTDYKFPQSLTLGSNLVLFKPHKANIEKDKIKQTRAPYQQQQYQHHGGSSGSGGSRGGAGHDRYFK